jgi:hypothetical protein
VTQLTHGLALNDHYTSCGLPLARSQLVALARQPRLLRIIPPTCLACLAAEHRDGATVPWYFKVPAEPAAVPRR